MSDEVKQLDDVVRFRTFSINKRIAASRTNRRNYTYFDLSTFCAARCEQAGTDHRVSQWISFLLGYLSYVFLELFVFDVKHVVGEAAFHRWIGE